MKDKTCNLRWHFQERQNTGNSTPATTTPMANANANATELDEIENLVAIFHHKKSTKTRSWLLFLNRNGNNKIYQTP